MTDWIDVAERRGRIFESLRAEFAEILTPTCLEIVLSILGWPEVLTVYFVIDICVFISEQCPTNATLWQESSALSSPILDLGLKLLCVLLRNIPWLISHYCSHHLFVSILPIPSLEVLLEHMTITAQNNWKVFVECYSYQQNINWIYNLLQVMARKGV